MRNTLAISLIGLFILHPTPAATAGFSKSERVSFQRSIIDKRHNLNRGFKRLRRNHTKYIIVHTAEAGLRSTLLVVSRGKRMRNGGRTYGGHAHYVIARNGRTYRTMDKDDRADHAGLSMWDGQTDISSLSVAIELVGYHYTPITKDQYRSVGLLISILKDVYGLDDRAVLTHSQIAYGEPNRWVKRVHRGRKKCAKNFDRSKAGLGTTWPFDPDVRAGRLRADRNLSAVFYERRSDEADPIGTNVITRINTAWAIAGEDFDDPTTLYRLPNGRLISGDQINRLVGWHRLPQNTLVLLNQQESPQTGINQGPVKTISDGLTAWSFAGPAYQDKTTFYFFPDGDLKNGRQISDWDDLPSNTKIIVGYQSPHEITGGTLPIRIAGNRYNHSETLYYFPNQSLLSGDQVTDFSRLPAGVLLFIPVRGS